MSAPSRSLYSTNELQCTAVAVRVNAHVVCGNSEYKSTQSETEKDQQESKEASFPNVKIFFNSIKGAQIFQHMPIWN